MEIKVDLGGRKRKELAAAIGAMTGADPVYKGPPSFAYAAGDVSVARDGSLVFEDGAPSGYVFRILSGISERGFYADISDVCETPETPNGAGGDAAQELPQATPADTEATEEIAEARAAVETDGSVIQMPLDGFTELGLENLRKLAAAKARLIKKSLGATDLPIEKDGDVLCFPWLGADASPEETTACMRFIAALCDTAKRQKRVLMTDRPAENEKYAFRCFLLRLGFIGAEYAEARKILLRNLTGNGSLKSGEPRRAARTGGAESQDTAPPVQETAVEERTRKRRRFSWRNLFFGFVAPR
jgi:hypothetical protein